MTHSKSTKKNINDAGFLKQIVQTYLQEYLDRIVIFILSMMLPKPSITTVNSSNK